MSTTGIGAYVEYGLQTNFTTALAVGAGDRAFGMDQRITTFSINENMFQLRDLNAAPVQKFAFGKFEGSLGVEWVVSDPWFFDWVLSVAASAGTGPYTHTYTDNETVNAFTVEVGIDTTTDKVIQLERCVARDITITTAIDEVVKCRGNFMIGKTPATAGTSLDASIVTDGIATPYTMVHATIENPDGTILAEVQSAELTMNPDIQYVYALDTTSGSAGFPANAVKGALNITGKFVLSIKNNAWWNAVRARAEPSDNTLTFKFTNGDTTPATDERTIDITMTGLGLGEISMSGFDPNELITEEISFVARDISVIATNNTSAAP